MIVCIPTRDLQGLQSTVEPHLPAADNLFFFNTETRQFHELSMLTPSNDADATEIDAMLCGSISRMALRSLLDQGIIVYGTDATTVSEAIGQFERGELEAVTTRSGGCGGGGCGCGGHAAHEAEEAEAEHACCGGHGHDHAHGNANDHECCGGGGHGHQEGHECCGGGGHGQGHGHGGCGCKG